MNIKITDEQFLETFCEQNGNYTNTANALTKKYNVPYTRQAMYKRAKKFPEEVWQLREDNRKHKLLSFAQDEGNSIRLRIYVYTILVNQLARYRLGRIAAAAKQPMQPRKAKPVDLSDRLMLLAKQNESLHKIITN